MRSKPSRAISEVTRIMRVRGLTQQAVADLLSAHTGRKVSQATVSKALQGRVPRLGLMLAYRAVLGVDLEAWASPADRLDDAA